jgi:hypothetical protein
VAAAIATPERISVSAVSAAAASRGSPWTSGTSRAAAPVEPMRPSAAIAASRSGAGRVVGDQLGDRLLEGGEAQAAGGAGRGDDGLGIGVGQPAVDVGQEPGVAEAAAHRDDQRAALVGGVDDAGQLEQREGGALGHLPRRAERPAGQIAEQPVGVGALAAGGRAAGQLDDRG